MFEPRSVGEKNKPNEVICSNSVCMDMYCVCVVLASDDYEGWMMLEGPFIPVALDSPNVVDLDTFEVQQ